MLSQHLQGLFLAMTTHKAPQKHCPTLTDLPAPPAGKQGWPWTEESPALPPLKPDGTPWPRVSLVIPCMNTGPFLEESIRSLLLQRYSDMELIIMDGGSSDESLSIIRKYDPWLTYWESQPDRGQSHAINKGLAKCTGLFFNWQNADDLLLPGSLAQTVLGFDRFPDAVYLSRYRLLLDETGTCTPKRREMPSRRIEDRDTFTVISGGSQPGGLMRLENVIAAGGVDEELECCMDEDLQLRLLISGPAYFLEDPGFIFRVRPNQKSQSLTRLRVREKIRIHKSIYARLPEGDPRHAYRTASIVFIHSWAARLLWQKHHYASALLHVAQGLIAKASSR